MASQSGPGKEAIDMALGSGGGEERTRGSGERVKEAGLYLFTLITLKRMLFSYAQWYKDHKNKKGLQLLLRC